MAGEHHAQSTRVEVERIGLGQPGEGVDRHHEVELETLETIRGVDHYVGEPECIECASSAGDLIAMRHRNRHPFVAKLTGSESFA